MVVTTDSISAFTKGTFSFKPDFYQKHKGLLMSLFDESNVDDFTYIQTIKSAGNGSFMFTDNSSFVNSYKDKLTNLFVSNVDEDNPFKIQYNVLLHQMFEDKTEIDITFLSIDEKCSKAYVCNAKLGVTISNNNLVLNISNFTTDSLKFSYRILCKFGLESGFDIKFSIFDREVVQERLTDYYNYAWFREYLPDMYKEYAYKEFSELWMAFVNFIDDPNGPFDGMILDSQLDNLDDFFENYDIRKYLDIH